MEAIKMRKNVTLFMIIIAVLLSFAACDTEEVSVVSLDTEYTMSTDISIVESDTPEVEIKFDDIIKLLDYVEFYAQEYDADMIASVCENVAKIGLELNGDVTRIVHVTDQSVPKDDPTSFGWAYVYEFSEEADAIAFEENRREFINATEEDGACLRYGRIVVFGTAQMLSFIEK